jgi:hypothetical protein
MIEIPKRTSLIEQVAAVLRQGLQRGEWPDGLPAERALSERLQVSRLTLRAALEILHREGVLCFAENRRRRLPVQRRGASRSHTPKVIAFLSPRAVYAHAPATIFKIYELRRHLQDADYGLEFVTDPRLRGQAVRRVLDGLALHTRARCWVLHWATEPVQRWFAERGIPTVVMGSCFEGVRLPSVDVDYRAMARHAVGVFIQMGHRRVALLARQTGFQGDLAREQGFVDGFTAERRAEAQALILRHDGTLGGVQAVLDAHLRALSPATGVLVSEAIDGLSALTHLARRGRRVPEDLSLIVGDDEWFLDHVTPAPARYRLDVGAYARRVSRMALRQAETGTLANRAVRIASQLVRGESLAPYASHAARG